MELKTKIKAYYYFALLGMAALIIGASLQSMIDKFDLSFSQGGLLVSVMSIAYIVFGFAASFFIDRLGHKVTIVIGCGSIFMAMFFFSFASGYIMLIIGSILNGIGSTFCNTSSGLIVNNHTRGDHKTMSGMQAVFALGAFLVPILVSFFVDFSIPYRPVMLIIAGISGFGVALQFILPEDLSKEITENVTDLEAEEPIDKNIKNLTERKKNNRIGWLLFFGILFFYVGIETTVSNWIVSYLTKAKSFTYSSAQIMLSTYWISMIVGRILFSFTPKGFNIHRSLFIQSTIILCSVALMMFIDIQSIIIATVIIMGLAGSSIFPLTLASSRRALNASSMTFVLVVIGGGFGTLTMPFITGIFADSIGVKVMPVIIIITAICLITLTHTHNAIYGKKYGKTL